MSECEGWEERYSRLEQKGLEDKREQDKELAYLQDKYENDVQYVQTKLTQTQDRLRLAVEENDRLKGQRVQK